MMTISLKPFLAFFMGITVMLSTAIDGPEVDPTLQQRERQPHTSQSLRQDILFCDDFGAKEVKLTNTVSFLKTIACDKPQVLHVDSDVVILSHADINTMNIFFVVHKRGNLTFSTQGIISLERDATLPVPIMNIAGEVTLKAVGQLPSHVAGGEDDVAHLVNVSAGGRLNSDSTLHYTPTSITASGIPRSSSEADIHGQPMLPLWDPALQAALDAHHANMNAMPDDPSTVGAEEGVLTKVNTNMAYPPVTEANTFKAQDGLIVADDWATLTHCDQHFPEDPEAVTNFNLERSVFCDVPRVFEVMPGYHRIIRSAHDLVFRNMFFIVPENARLSLEAKGAIFIDRDEDLIDLPLFVLSGGELNVHAEGSKPEFTNGESVDNHEILVTRGISEVHFGQEVKYTRTSFAVNALSDTPKDSPGHKDLRGTANQTPEDLDETIQSERDGGLSSIVNGHEGLPPEQHQQPQPYQQHQPQQEHNYQPQHEDERQQQYEDERQPQYEDERQPHHEDKQQDKQHQHQQQQHGPAFRTASESAPDTSTAESPRSPLKTQRPPIFGLQGEGMRTRSSPRTDQSTSPHHYGWRKAPAPAMPEQRKACNNTRKRGWRSKPVRSSTQPTGTAFPSLLPSKPARESLRVGEKLRGKLMSGDGRSMISTAFDGSVRFSKEVSPPDVDVGSDGDVEIDAEFNVRSTTLLPSDTRKAMQVLEGRLLPKNEEETCREADAAAAAGKPRGSRGLRGPWTSRSTKGQLEEGVRFHPAEVELSVNNRGCVEVHMDGCNVVSKAGRHRREWMNRFPWQRRKDDSYELRVTEDGLEVTRNQKKIWGLKASDIEKEENAGPRWQADHERVSLPPSR